MAALSASRRLVLIALLATFAAVALLASGTFSSGKSHTASPRWNKTNTVAAHSAFAKPFSPRWN